MCHPSVAQRLRGRAARVEVRKREPGAEAGVGDDHSVVDVQVDRAGLVVVGRVGGSGGGVWAKAVGGTGPDSGWSVAVGSAGNVNTTGVLTFPGDVDPGAGATDLTSGGSVDVFVSKLDSSGDLVWAKSFGGSEDDYCESVAVDSSGNVYTTGRFFYTFDFDPGAGTVNLTQYGSADGFVSKLDSSGTSLWAKGLGS